MDSTPATDVANFDKLWNFNAPGETEAKFRELLPAAEAANDPTIELQLLTQIARTQGLQRKFEDAHATLDAVEARLTGAEPVVRVRYLLERGRVFNSSQQKESARPLFIDAWEAAKQAGLEGFAVDAAHMMGIVEPPDEALAWNEKAMALAESSEQEAARKWLGSLYNNIGWTYHDMGDFASALATFEKALAWREAHGTEPTIRIAKWCVARALRSLGRLDEALQRQQALREAGENDGRKDGFVYEELGELHLAQGRESDAREYFAIAFAELSKDEWLTANEPDRIARIKKLAGLE